MRSAYGALLSVVASFLFVLGLAYCVGSAGCTKTQATNVVNTIGSAAPGACSLLEGVDDSGALRTICATVEEVASVISFILTLRTIDAGAVACAPLPGSTFCATSAERAKGILFLSRLRAARLMLDAGAQ